MSLLNAKLFLEIDDGGGKGNNRADEIRSTAKQLLDPALRIKSIKRQTGTLRTWAVEIDLSPEGLSDFGSLGEGHGLEFKIRKDAS